MNKRLLIPLIFLMPLMGGSLSMRPAAFLSTATDGGSLNPWTGQPVTLAAAGLTYAYRENNLSVEGNFLFAFLLNLHRDQLFFQPIQGTRRVESLRVIDDSYWYNFSMFRIAYKLGNFDLFATNEPTSWGVGINGLSLSGKPTYYPSLGFTWELTDELDFRWIYGSLNSGIPDTAGSAYYSKVRGKFFDVSRSISAHRLEWTPAPGIRFGATETVVYGVRQVEFLYLVPVLPYLVSEPYIGDTDNIQISADVLLQLRKDIAVYLALFVDEWKPETTFDRAKNSNWFAWQAGLDWQGLFHQQDRFRVEWTWTDHRVYRHRFDINDLYSDGYPLGFWAGPHARELLIDYFFRIGDQELLFRYTDVKRGQITDQMLADQYENVHYERFTGPVPFEQRRILEGKWSRAFFFQDLRFEAGLQVIDWQNAGFDPRDPDPDRVKDLSRVSIQLGFRYHFSYPGWDRKSKEKLN